MAQVLKDDTTLEDNKVSENGFMVVMITKVGRRWSIADAKWTVCIDCWFGDRCLVRPLDMQPPDVSGQDSCACSCRAVTGCCRTASHRGTIADVDGIFFLAYFTCTNNY